MVPDAVRYYFVNLHDSILWRLYCIDWHILPPIVTVFCVSHLIMIGANVLVGVTLLKKQLSSYDDLKMAAKGFANGTLS